MVGDQAAGDRAVVITALRGMLNTLADNLGTDATGLGEDDIIPDTGVLDSAGVIEFVMLVDSAYGLALEAEDMTIDNLGSLSAVAAFVAARRANRPS
jgi:D-alanine--poly(phosphoribitol) ligase subunit 2